MFLFIVIIPSRQFYLLLYFFIQPFSLFRMRNTFFTIFSLIFKIDFNWRIITLQCDGFCHSSAWTGHRYTRVPSLLNTPPTSLPTSSFQVVRALALGSLHHTSTSHRLFISHMAMYMFRCYFLKSSTFSFSHCAQKSVPFFLACFFIVLFCSSCF